MTTPIDVGIDGFSARPLTMPDAEAAFDVYAAGEAHDLGGVEVELADIIGDWQRGSFDLESDSVGVFDGQRLVAAAEVFLGYRSEACVHPAYRGRGIGTWLARWTREAASSSRAAGRSSSETVGQSVPEGSPAETLLRGLGFTVRWTSWILEMPEGQTIAPQPIPSGYDVRHAVPGVEDRAVFQIVEDAFSEWPERSPALFEDWAPLVVGRDGFEPGHLRVVTNAAGQIVGTCFLTIAGDCGYVQYLAVRSHVRGLGLARALLADAFERSRAFGIPRQELSTDSRTGALGLYLTVGMRVRMTYHNWATAI
jgi:GNAT superfamily N-acetyltransferase